MQWTTKRQRTPTLLYKIRLIKFIYQDRQSYATIHNLEGNRPSNIDENFKEILTIMDGVATTSPSPPRPTLARCSQDHKFDIQNIPPLLHGNPSLYRIWRLNHHGEDHS
jgi:hypothetical protein